ncbi:uncharacterized protein LOC109018300 [Juglans regia]|uniref:Uncharacterized protein LOC109018300 n=1 Tax=Juglans regia TaxID=51240 RepID=A0A2I4HIL4_JUGRE|nr:uncharacterized protein LOC109018300 [Juglans regia]
MGQPPRPSPSVSSNGNQPTTCSSTPTAPFPPGSTMGTTDGKPTKTTSRTCTTHRKFKREKALFQAPKNKAALGLFIHSSIVQQKPPHPRRPLRSSSTALPCTTVPTLSLFVPCLNSPKQSIFCSLALGSVRCHQPRQQPSTSPPLAEKVLPTTSHHPVAFPLVPPRDHLRPLPPPCSLRRASSLGKYWNPQSHIFLV